MISNKGAVVQTLISENLRNHAKAAKTNKTAENFLRGVSMSYNRIDFYTYLVFKQRNREALKTSDLQI